MLLILKFSVRKGGGLFRSPSGCRLNVFLKLSRGLFVGIHGLDEGSEFDILYGYTVATSHALGRATAS